MNVAVAEHKYPPMLTQYLEYKARAPDTLLFFQVGDFYELFFADAEVVARTLNLTLTSRDKSSANPVPMCGVPVAAVDGYVERLVDAGHAVAIVSQVGGQENGKGMFARALERVVTPGIRLLGQQSVTNQIHYVAAIHREGDDQYACAWSDVQTGRVMAREGLSCSALGELLARIAPREVVVPQSIQQRSNDSGSKELRAQIARYTARIRSDDRDSQRQARTLSSITGYAGLGVSGRKALRLLAGYIDETTVAVTIPLREVVLDADDGYLQIDAATRAHLELVRNARDGATRGTLFEHLHRTVTAAGSRLLQQWLVAPLRALEIISARHDIVEALRLHSGLRERVIELLRGIADIERIVARAELRIVTPREVGSLRDALQRVPPCAEAVAELFLALPENPVVAGWQQHLIVPFELADLLQRALIDSPPPSSNDGGIFRDGYDPELDRLRGINVSGRTWLEDLERRERERTGIHSLKVRYNNVLGFFIEVTRAHVSKVPSDYIPRQSTAAAERYVTEEIKRHESDVLGARDRQALRERELFERLRGQISPFAGAVRSIAAAIASCDVLCAFAEVAERESYVRPELDQSKNLLITNGRHPVLETMLRGDFVPNSLAQRDQAELFLLLTGPNMGGKSTYLRQTALIVILAQIGSFVPAERAEIGIVDKIFTRIGASDDISEGESTFMVEMKEASRILASATDRSLLLIDEIGRGTATADGLAIARAIVEWIVATIGCRTLFATHFHELTELAEVYPAIKNISVGSIEREDGVVFTHQICDGAASKSYGIDVARLAGLPNHLLVRARELLSQHRSEPRSGQLSLFQAAARVQEPDDYRALRAMAQRLATLSIDDMTPRAAWQLVDELRSSLKEQGIL